jgi:hypothetical protein
MVAMATKPTIQVANQVPGPQHYLPPTARELRAQAVQRLQSGLFGIAAMLLLVGLANIIMDRARLTEANSVPTTPAAAASSANDPLADIGVVPAADPSTSPVASQAPVATQ